MGQAVFVDEYKQRGHILVAVAMSGAYLPAARRAMRGHILPRQRRVQFRKESESRKKQVLDTISALDVSVDVYDAGRFRDPAQGRAECIRRLVSDLLAKNTEKLILEVDDAAVLADRALRYRLVREHGMIERFEYEHLRAYEEPLLAIPDAIAWCWGKGGWWRRRLMELDLRERRL